MKMELSLNIEQLQLKSEYLHSNPKYTHFHNNNENPLLISWNECITVIYSLNSLTNASVWNPVKPLILPINNPIISVLTFDSKVYCVDKIGSIYYLKQLHCDSPELFDCSSLAQNSQQPLTYNYKWISIYTQNCSCEIFKATDYSDGIALILLLDEWITIQLLKITINNDNKPVIFNTCNKQIRTQKQFTFLVTYFISFTWRDWFSGQRVKDIFEPSVLESQDIFLIGTENSYIYYTTSDISYKTVTPFLNYMQNIVHIQFCDFESKKLLLVSSSGILTVVHCDENIPSSFVYLTVIKVVAALIVDNTVIISDGVHLFLITLDKQFSKIVKQIVTPLKGVLSLHKFKFNDVTAITQLTKVYKLSPTYEIITQEDEIKFKFNEKCILENIKDLCKSIESLEEQHEKMNKYINAVSIVARKDLVAQYCSLDVLIYSGSKAIKLGALQDEYIFVLKLSLNCSWLSFSSSIWQLLVRVVDSKNSSSYCSLHSFDVNLFNNNNPLKVKLHLISIVAEQCTSGTVYCELVCKVQNDLINHNHSLVIPLLPLKLNALYFVNAEKREKIPVINPLEDRHKYIFKFPENLSIDKFFVIIFNKNKHRISKSLYTNITNNMPKTLYLKYFGKIVTVVLDDKIKKTIILECIDLESLTAVRNGIFNELSNDEPVTIKYSVFANVQKQLCLLEELLSKKQDNNNIIKEIQNQISTYLPV